MRFFKALKPIKALSFDLDDTLYDNVPVMERAEQDFACYLQMRYGLPAFAGQRSFWAEHKARTRLCHPEYINDVTFWREQTLQAAFATLHLSLSAGEARELVGYFIRIRSQIKVPERSLKILSCLRRVFPLAALSNGNSDLNLSGLKAYFDCDLRPSLSGPAAKPCPDLFLAWADSLHLKAAEILHVGDDPITDVQGAMQTGCQCAWLCRGYAGRGAGEEALTTLPTFRLDSLDELSFLWQTSI